MAKLVQDRTEINISHCPEIHCAIKNDAKRDFVFSNNKITSKGLDIDSDLISEIDRLLLFYERKFGLNIVSNSDKQTFVSVIVPTYNRAYCLSRTIESVIEQTFEDWELIIVDNNSTDLTDEVLAGYTDNRIKIHKINNDGIIAKSRNKGVKEARGKYLAFLDSDDWWMPTKLEESVRVLEAGKDLVYHDLYLMKLGQHQPKFWKKAKTRQVKAPVFEDLLLNGNAINNSSVVVRRETIEAINCISEDPPLIAAEDYDAWLRVAKLTNRFYRLPHCLGYYTIGSDNLTSAERSIKNVECRLDLYQADFKKLKRHIPAWASYSLGRAYFKRRNVKEARLYLWNVVRNKAPLKLRLKSLVSLILLAIFYER